MATPQKTKKFDKEGFRLVASFKKAELDYEIDERLEAGIQLHGSEVKVLRAGKCVISGAHVRVVGGEALLFGMQIPEYPWSHQFNHEPDRPRKLLLHKREIERLADALQAKGSACVPIRVYFQGSKVKIELAVGTGRKHHDRRDAIKDREMKREISRVHR